jgi:hypothetical protein
MEIYIRKGIRMCDYSLYAIPNRLAVEGEELVVHRFSTGSIGLASAADLRTSQPAQDNRNGGFWRELKKLFDLSPACALPAVCVPPGARLILKDIPVELRKPYGIEAEEGVVFTQLTAAANTYRDALRLHNGRNIRLQDLQEGQRLEVLSVEGCELEPLEQPVENAMIARNR